MKSLADMRIASKMLLVVLLLGALTFAVAGVGSFQLTRLSAIAGRLIGNQAESLKLASAANEKLAHLHQLWLERLIETDTEKLDHLRGEISTERSALLKQMADLKPLMRGSDLKNYDAIESGLAAYDTLMAPVEQLVVKGDHRQAETRAQDQGGDLYAKINESFSSLVRRQDHDLDQGAADAAATARSTTFWLLAASMAAIVGVAALTLTLVRKTITGPLSDTVTVMNALARGDTSVEALGAERADEVGQIGKALRVFRQAAIDKNAAEAANRAAAAEQRLVVQTLSGGLERLANGDLTAGIHSDFPPSYAAVKDNFNVALASLRDLIGSVAESTMTIRTGSGEIAQASEDLARRTEANAASLEQTSAAVTQMDERLKATAAAATRTVESADGAIATVTDGRSLADQAVQAMSRVAAGAESIDSVIEGLDKIAFQTRVLAMNAAVEAGRAGEAGRGFAVVADLVSALAMRSEEEAARAREQLTATQADIVSAAAMVERVDTSLAGISADVDEVHTLLRQMAMDNQAQSTAITEISVAIGTMDRSTQQNAAMVEETSAAARNLSSEVSILADQAGKFDIGKETQAVSEEARMMVPKAVKPNGMGDVSPVRVRPSRTVATAGMSF